MTRHYFDWPETLDVRLCDRHHWAHDHDQQCPLCAADVPPIPPEPHRGAFLRVWFAAGAATWGAIAAVVWIAGAF